jgi:RNA polymerase sigma-70 factor (ECF subfamily)
MGGEAHACDGLAMRDDDERALLSRIAGGDQHALRCLYAAYRARLWSYLIHQLDGDAGWTEEILQDAFLAVWRSAGTYRGEAQPATWLFRIAHNLAANARRARGRRPQGERLDVADADDEWGDVLAEASHEDAVLDRLTLAAALDRLSPAHREALDLCFVQGFRIEEVATILDIPPGTVKSRISYARLALRAHLAAERRDYAGGAHTAATAGEGCREGR